MIITTLIFAFEHCKRASDIVVQLHPFIVLLATYIQSHSTPRIRHDGSKLKILSSWRIVSKDASCGGEGSPQLESCTNGDDNF